MVGEARLFDSMTKGNLEVDNNIVADNLIVKDAPSKFMRLDFDSAPILKGKVLADGTTLARAAPTGAGGDENLCMFPEGTLEYHAMGTQTLLGPRLVATGLDVTQDIADDDGIEYCGGILACNKLVFTVGTHAAFYASMRFSISDVLGLDTCLFGWRKQEAYQADFNDYDEMAAFDIQEGVIYTSTALNAGAVVDVDTTNEDWANTEIHTLEVRVSAAGVVTFHLDGSVVIASSTFTFDDTEIVTPFFHFLHDATATAVVVLEEFQCGLQTDRR